MNDYQEICILLLSILQSLEVVTIIELLSNWDVMYKMIFHVVAYFTIVISSFGQTSTSHVPATNFPTNTLSAKGAWCWFADPRAIHYKNANGTINSTYIGYIDA